MCVPKDLEKISRLRFQESSSSIAHLLFRQLVRVLTNDLYRSFSRLSVLEIKLSQESSGLVNSKTKIAVHERRDHGDSVHYITPVFTARQSVFSTCHSAPRLSTPTRRCTRSRCPGSPRRRDGGGVRVEPQGRAGHTGRSSSSRSARRVHTRVRQQFVRPDSRRPPPASDATAEAPRTFHPSLGT